MGARTGQHITMTVPMNILNNILLVLLVTFKVISCLADMVQIHIGPCFSHRTNRTHLKDDFYAVGALNKGRSTVADYDENLLGFLGVE